MSDFAGFRDSYIKSELSDTISGSDSVSPPPVELSKQKSLNIPSINVKPENVDSLLSKSLDIKKQLSQSFQGNAGGAFGGISKPQSRRNSVMAVRSNNGSDNEDDDDGQGNERKRRDNINDKIQELLTLIPAEFFQDTAADIARAKEESKGSAEDAEIAAAVKNSGTKDGKPNKGQILTKSVEYLQYLQNLIDGNNRKEVELIMKLKTLELQQQGLSTEVPITVGHTSAERALGKIGVGPLSDEYFQAVLVNSANTNKSTQRRGSNS